MQVLNFINIFMNKISYYLILSLILFYGIYLRFYELDTWSFWIDEWYSSLVSYFSYLNSFIPKLINGNLYISQYLFTFSQSISFSIFWVSDFSARLPSFIFWIIQILIYFIFANAILKNTKYKNIYILFLFFIFVLSTWQIIWTREARFYELLSLLYLLNIYFLWQYFVKNNKNIFKYFIIILILSLLFHPFFLSILIISIFLFLYKIIKNKNKNDYKKLIYIFISLNIYLIIDLIIRYITVWQTNITQTVTQINYNLDLNFLTYINFYLRSIYSELWIIFIAYIIMIIYFLLKKKYIEFIIFWISFIINIVAISYWYMAHSRYMFHLYSIITFIWGLWIILFINFINKKFKNKLITIITIFITFFTITQTYKLTIIPQRFYYIDFTSPKPNFKMAYNFLEKNYFDEKIISWFPHICYWYNIRNFQKCEYAININLTWNKNNESYLEKRQRENYTNINFINDIKDLEKNKNYLFVLDDLSIKNMINKKLFDEINNNCALIYKDVWDYESSNFIWIWRCNIKK